MEVNTLETAGNHSAMVFYKGYNFKADAPNSEFNYFDGFGAYVSGDDVINFEINGTNSFDYTIEVYEYQ